MADQRDRWMLERGDVSPAGASPGSLETATQVYLS